MVAAGYLYIKIFELSTSENSVVSDKGFPKVALTEAGTISDNLRIPDFVPSKLPYNITLSIDI